MILIWYTNNQKIFCVLTRDADSLFFVGLPTLGLENLGLRTPTLTVGLTVWQRDSRLRTKTQTLGDSESDSTTLELTIQTGEMVSATTSTEQASDGEAPVSTFIVGRHQHCVETIASTIVNTKQKPRRRLDHRRLLHNSNVSVCSAVYAVINLPIYLTGTITV